MPAKEYTFRLNKIYISTTNKRKSPKALKYIRSKLERAFKKPVKLDQKLNEYIWRRGAEKPARKVTVVVEDKGEYVVAYLKEEGDSQ